MKRIVFILVLSLLLGACERKKETVIRMETSLGNIRLKLYDETVLHRDNILKLIREGYYNGMLFHRVIKDFMIQTGDPDSKSARPGMVLGANDIGYTLKAEIVPKYFHKRGVLAAAREADNINPERSSSGSHFYIVQIEKRKWLAAKNQLGDRLFKPLQEEFQRYKKTGQYQKADSLLRYVNEEIEKQYAENPYKMSPETREMYKSVGGTPFLDGDYTVFGEIVEGMDVLEKIALVATDSNDRPKEDVIILGTKLKRK